jgi:hypothetical protein
MAIAKKPKSNAVAPAPVDDTKADAFIAGAGKAAPALVPEQAKAPVTVRFDPDLLRRVDEAAKKLHISRSAWILSTLSRAVESGEG